MVCLPCLSGPHRTLFVFDILSYPFLVVAAVVETTAVEQQHLQTNNSDRTAPTDAPTAIMIWFLALIRASPFSSVCSSVDSPSNVAGSDDGLVDGEWDNRVVVGAAEGKGVGGEGLAVGDGVGIVVGGGADGVGVGLTLGCGVGWKVAPDIVGEIVGRIVGVPVGGVVGIGVGPLVGIVVGISVGCIVVGLDVGCIVGVDVGCPVGVAVGCDVGVTVGCVVGIAVGCRVGVVLGTRVLGEGVGLTVVGESVGGNR